LSPAAISVPKIPKNALSAGTLSRTPLGELTALPIPPAGFLGREEKGGMGKERREWDLTRFWEKFFAGGSDSLSAIAATLSCTVMIFSQEWS